MTQRSGSIFRQRMKALRAATRRFWRTVVLHPAGFSFSRRACARMCFHEARCGLMTGGKHSWGPLHHEYEGARWRKQKCRWCEVRHLPGEELRRNPPTDEERRTLPEVGIPTETDIQRGIELAKEIDR